MKDSDDGLRSMPSRAVWHCQQAVEMALKSAMLRTCGVAEDEVTGGAAHNLIDFVLRLKTAEANTEEQRRAQEVPLLDDDVEWLKRAYLAARYPKPGRYGVPTMLYNNADAERAQRLAEGFLQWAEQVEDLPDPGKCRRRWSTPTPSPPPQATAAGPSPSPVSALSAKAPSPAAQSPQPKAEPKAGGRKRASATEPAGETHHSEGAETSVSPGGAVDAADGADAKRPRTTAPGDDDVPRRWSRRRA